MGKCKTTRHFFPLTSFQIGDLQSYLSDLTIFLAPDSKRFYVLVDNRPWLEDLVTGPAHLWQLMVTKSRMSPFANTRGQRGRKATAEFSDLKTSSKALNRSQTLKRWFSILDASELSRKRALLPVKKLRNSLLANSKLHRTLYGFIVFEVAWKDVRGINYFNELQTDTSLAIEAKYMRRWEFDSIGQAARGITSWFPGTPHERCLFEKHLNSMLGDVFHDALREFTECGSTDNDEKTSDSSMSGEDESPCSPSKSLGEQIETLEDQTSMVYTPPPDGPYKRRKLTNSLEADFYTEEAYHGGVCTPLPSEEASYASDCEEAAEATEYKDVLLLFRFNDRDLPFELQEIIMPDLRLLPLLEAGLPAWVIFFQSYPVFCHIYRPWMCPLARALYVAISLVTVVIGFYDLYKNVPVLKATASKLCGPLFDWIETWEMVSRIKYLGTMLFLHHSQKALMWFLLLTRTVRSFLSVLTQPLAGPFMLLLEVLLPIWNLVMRIGGCLCSFIGFLMETSWNLVENIVEILLFPVWFVSSIISLIVTAVMYPIFWCLWGILYAPIRLILGLSSLLAFIYKHIYDLVGSIWLVASSMFKVASTAEVTVTTYEVSMWRALWNDLFSQVFRAARSILYGFVAFFTACNRHRLSIYNHIQEFIRRLYQPQPPQRLQLMDSRTVQESRRRMLADERERRLLLVKNTKQS